MVSVSCCEGVFFAYEHTIQSKSLVQCGGTLDWGRRFWIVKRRLTCT